MQAEPDSLQAVAGAALDSDPYASGDTASGTAGILVRRTQRVEAVEGALAP